MEELEKEHQRSLSRRSLKRSSFHGGPLTAAPLVGEVSTNDMLRDIGRLTAEGRRLSQVLNRFKKEIVLSAD